MKTKKMLLMVILGSMMICGASFGMQQSWYERARAAMGYYVPQSFQNIVNKMSEYKKTTLFLALASALGYEVYRNPDGTIVSVVQGVGKKFKQLFGVGDGTESTPETVLSLSKHELSDLADQLAKAKQNKAEQRTIDMIVDAALVQIYQAYGGINMDASGNNFSFDADCLSQARNQIKNYSHLFGKQNTIYLLDQAVLEKVERLLQSNKK